MQQLWLENLKPVNGSWTLGFLHKNFPNVQDIYLSEQLFQVDYPANSILYLDDEVLCITSHENATSLINKQLHQILIFKVLRFFEYAKQKSANCIFFPWSDVLDEAISTSLLSNHIEIIAPTSSGLAYSCLNRRWTAERMHLIWCLHSHNLIDRGCVTGSNFKGTANIDGIKDNDLDHYQSAPGIGFERFGQTLHNIPVSSNTINSIYINQTYLQPINISVETTATPFFPTEKSFLSFATKRIPIIIADQGRVTQLREQGFDMFDDIIDHSYDQITSWQKRVQAAIELNINALTEPVIVDQQLINRLTQNFMHFTTSWLYAKINELQQQIELIRKVDV